jgi:hypothetical protein
MNQLVAACGLDCAACPSYVATMADDRAALAALAEKWGKDFGFPATADNVRCHGCSAKDGVQIGHCSQCAVRLCALGKGHATCADCAEFGCAVLTGFIKEIPGARERLEALRAAR